MKSAFVPVFAARATSVPAAEAFHFCSTWQDHVSVEQFLTAAPYVVSHFLHTSIAIRYVSLTDSLRGSGQIWDPKRMKENGDI